MSFHSEAASLQIQITNEEFESLTNNINSLCYCGKPLQAHQQNWTGDWICSCCCQSIPMSMTTFYKCNQGYKCIYREIRGIDYGICRKCCYTQNNEELNNKYNRNGFLHNKFKASLKIISLVCLPRFVIKINAVIASQ